MGEHYEIQIEQRDGAWWMTLTISSQGQFWTSEPSRLKATTHEEAVTESQACVRALSSSTLGGEG